MSKLSLGMQLVIGLFIFFGVISAISSYMLIRIKKTQYPDLWNIDEIKATVWNKAHNLALREAVWQKPDWVRENKNAQFWVLIYKIAALFCLLFLLLPGILAIFGIYLFD